MTPGKTPEKTPENRNPATGRDDGADRDLSDAEAYEQIAALLQGSQGVLGEEALIRHTAARLALLEEHFARLCTVVGKLEQEIRLLKGEVSDDPS